MLELEIADVLYVCWLPSLDNKHIDKTGTNIILFVMKGLEVKVLHMCVFPSQYMFQNEEAEAFPASGCEEQ